MTTYSYNESVKDLRAAVAAAQKRLEYNARKRALDTLTAHYSLSFFKNSFMLATTDASRMFMHNPPPGIPYNTIYTQGIPLPESDDAELEFRIINNNLFSINGKQSIYFREKDWDNRYKTLFSDLFTRTEYFQCTIDKHAFQEALQAYNICDCDIPDLLSPPESEKGFIVRLGGGEEIVSSFPIEKIGKPATLIMPLQKKYLLQVIESSDQQINFGHTGHEAHAARFLYANNNVDYIMPFEIHNPNEQKLVRQIYRRLLREERK